MTNSHQGKRRLGVSPWCPRESSRALVVHHLPCPLCLWDVNGKEIITGLFHILNLQLPRAGIKWKWECFLASEINKLLEITGARTWIFQNTMCHSSSYKTCVPFIFMDALQFIMEWWVRRVKDCPLTEESNFLAILPLSSCHSMKITKNVGCTYPSKCMRF